MIMNEGGPHALRSAVEPAYLGTGDPGFTSGGTVGTSEPMQMQSQYENIFGPAVRDIKWDEQRHKRHQRWHLPDALKGSNAFLTDRIDGLITDATTSPFTKNILPYLYMDQPDKKIKWNVYSFDEGIASRVPYESAARVLPQSKRSFAGYAVRQGLAIAMEHNFMMSPQGMDNFRKQLMQLVGSIQLTNDLDVHMALLYAPSYQKQMDEKYFDNQRTLTQNTRMHVDLFGFMQKNENALDYLIEDAKNHLTKWGSKPPTFMLCNGALTRSLTMTPEKTNYITAGPDGKRKLAQGPELPSYRGLQIIHTRQFSLEAGTAPRDMLRRRVRVCEHYWIPWEITNALKRFEFYDQSRDSMFYLSFKDLWDKSFPQNPDSLRNMLQHYQSTDNNLNALDGDAPTTASYLTEAEFNVGKMLGVFTCSWPEAQRTLVPLSRNIDLVREFNIEGKPQVDTFCVKKSYELPVDDNDNELQNFVNTRFLIILKLYIRQNFLHLLPNGNVAAQQFLARFENLIQLMHANQFQILDVTAPGAEPNDHIQNVAAFRFKRWLTAAHAQGAYAYDREYTQKIQLIDHTMQKLKQLVTGNNLTSFLCTFLEFIQGHKDLTKFLQNAFKVWHSNIAADNLQWSGNAITAYLLHGDTVFPCYFETAIMQSFLKNEIYPEFEPTDKIRFMAIDLLLLRPCIEHYMLAVIMGRGGGPEELGATFWGQTELSCYDDSQHGIWGMSYKYHERAIVINDRNLIRVFDVCFDGYCGGNDSSILCWDDENVAHFKNAMLQGTEAYTGPSMIVMGLPTVARHETFPNPIVLNANEITAGSHSNSAVPDRALRSSPAQIAQHQAFKAYFTKSHPTPKELELFSQARVFEMYLKYSELDAPVANTAPGHMSYSGETEKPAYSFSGHMATILNGHKEEMQGSGHLGTNFVGVASVREGRGLMPKGMPALVHAM